jgi:membrane fusion protein, multidrug efflux system
MLAAQGRAAAAVRQEAQERLLNSLHLLSARRCVAPSLVQRAMVGACLAGLLVACSPSPPSGAGKGGTPGGAMPPMPVNVVQVALRKVPVSIEAVGTLEGLKEVEVRARVAGTLQQQLFREGAPVAAGAALYRIERAPFEIALDAARANVAQMEARFEQSRRESARLASLIADKAISQREADEAGSSLKTSEATLAAARAQEREAALNLSYTDVAAPIAGVVQRSIRSVGSFVSPAIEGGVLATIVQTNPIRVRFALTEAEAAQLRKGANGRAREVRLQLPTGEFAKEVGRIDFASSIVDARLGTVQLRAELNNAGGTWLPGQFVRVQVNTGEQDAYLVPQVAVMSGEQGRFVWLIGPDGKALARPVQAGAWLGSDWVIRSGLANGDKVITSNLIKLRPGAPVQEAPPPGAAAGSASAPASAAKQ